MARANGRHLSRRAPADRARRANRRSGRWRCLLGRYPAAAASGQRAAAGAAGPRPAGLPSELLERRPDVIAAERRVAAAFNRVGEAKAARLPTIALTAGVSAISSELFVLKNHDNPVWNFGAGLLAPVYKGGALKTQVEIRTVEQKQAVAAYASVGLRAFSEVENALVGGDRRARPRADPGGDPRRQPARARDRADTVQGRQHRPALRHTAAAGAELRRSGAHPRPGRAARAARQPAPRARRQLRGAARSPQPISQMAVAKRSCGIDSLRTRGAPVRRHTSSATGTRGAVPERSTASVTPNSSCS